MTAQAGTAPSGGGVGVAERTRRLLRDRPLIPLTALLVLLVLLMQLAQPGVLTQNWVGSRSAPIRSRSCRAAQTLAMLTGGIDLSVGTVASMAAFIMATQTGSLGPGAPSPRPVGGLIAGIAERDRRGGLQGPPTDHDAWYRPGDPGPHERLPIGGRPGRDQHPADRRLARRRHDARLAAEQPVPVHPTGRAHHPRAALQRVRTAALRGRRQRRGGPAGRRSRLAGPPGALHHLGAAGGDRRHARRRPRQDRQPRPGRGVRAAVRGRRRDRRDVDHGGRGGYSGTIIGALS